MIPFEDMLINKSLNLTGSNLTKQAPKILVFALKCLFFHFKLFLQPLNPIESLVDPLGILHKFWHSWASLKKKKILFSCLSEINYTKPLIHSGQIVINESLNLIVEKYYRAKVLQPLLFLFHNLSL